MKLNEERAVEPADAERLSEGLIRVPLVTPTLPPATRTNSYLVRGDRSWWLVDAGPTDVRELRLLQREIDALGEALAGVIVTHHHRDHVGGVLAVSSHYRVPVIVHRDAHPHLPRTLRDGACDWVVVEDRELECDGLRLVDTSGHAPGHLSVVTPTGEVLCGDLVAGMGTIIIAPPDGDMSAYFASLRWLQSCGDAPCYPAHGLGFESAAERARSYLAHREAREQRVLDALDVTAGRSPLEVTRRAWSDVAVHLLPMATASCRAHLRKLSLDGAAVERRGRWYLPGD